MTKKILLIDDDEDDRSFLTEIITSLIPDVLCEAAANGKEAFLKLKTMQFFPDLIFLDLNMPLMNGRQFLAAIKNDATLMEIPVVVLSTSSDPNAISETRALGAKYFMTKPDKIAMWEIQVKDLFDKIAL